MVRRYVREAGFTPGIPDNDLAAVIVTSTVRLPAVQPLSSSGLRPRAILDRHGQPPAGSTFGPGSLDDAVRELVVGG